MTSRERVLAALRRQEADRVPVCEINVDRSFAIKLQGLRENVGDTALRQRNPYTLEELKAVSARLGLDNLFYLCRQPIFSKTHQGKDGRMFSGEGLIKTKADLALVDLPDPTKDEFYAEAEVFAKGKGDKAMFFLTRGGLAPVMLSMGFDHFFLCLYDDPDLVKTLLTIYFDWVLEVAKRANQLGFDAFVTADDCAFKTGPMFSPKTYRELIAPHYARLVQTLEIPWILHSDGNIMDIVPILIELGVTGVHPFENTAMDIREAKRRFGDKICLLGNVDLNLLAGGDPAAVEEEVRGLIRDLAPGGGYIVASGNSLAAYLDPDCVLAYTRSVHKYGRYPIRIDQA